MGSSRGRWVDRLSGGQVVCTHVPLSPSSIIWYRSSSSDGKVTVGPTSNFLCVRLQWFVRVRAHGLRKGNERPAFILHSVMMLLDAELG